MSERSSRRFCLGSIRFFLLTAGLLLVPLPARLQAQARVTSTPPELFARGALPSSVRRHVDRLGERVRSPGRERVILTGELTDASGARFAARVIHQLPVLVRVQGFRPGGIELAFDGSRPGSTGALTTADEDVMESLAADSVEGFLETLRLGGALRLLGRRFRPDPRRFPGYTGPSFDIYELSVAVRARRNRPARTKRYYFDWRTGLLHGARYTDFSQTPVLRVETRFSGWMDVDRSAYPGRIERYENGRLVFSFVATAISAGPRGSPSDFRLP